MVTTTNPELKKGHRSAVRSTVAYKALLLFSYYYFIRPEDFIPGLAVIPLGKIMGGVALLALMFGSTARRGQKIPPELKVLTVLLGHMLLTVVFAVWHAGAYEYVVNRFSKGVIVAYLIVLTLDTVNELRKLLLIQVGSVALITIASVLIHKTQEGRLMGIQKGILENPNDLAINIAINFPLAVAFMLGEKGALKRFFWALSLAFMMYATIATYSRSGMVALVITISICFWEFVVKGRRMMLLIGSLIVAVFGLGVVFGTPRYLVRLETMVTGTNLEGSLDKNSIATRKQLLVDSIKMTIQHPIFGVGPGNFAVMTGHWQPAHNTYTGLGAETGVPGLFLFVLLLALSLRKIKKVRKLPGYFEHENIRLWTSALQAALIAYIVAAIFATTEYNLFPYFMVGYICVLYKIARSAETQEVEKRTNNGGSGLRWRRIGYQSDQKREPAWSR